MSIKNQLLMMAAMGLFLSPSDMWTVNGGVYKSVLTEDDINTLQNKIAELRKKQLLKQGCKEFDFGDVTIIALNEKNAIRKYENYKKGKITPNRSVLRHY